MPKNSDTIDPSKTVQFWARLNIFKGVALAKKSSRLLSIV
jgi:hypothetical protein